jgi:hypothetical protein
MDGSYPVHCIGIHYALDLPELKKTMAPSVMKLVALETIKCHIPNETGYLFMWMVLS